MMNFTLTLMLPFSSLYLCVCVCVADCMYESAETIEKTTAQKITLISQLFLNLITGIHQQV